MAQRSWYWCFIDWHVVVVSAVPLVTARHTFSSPFCRWKGMITDMTRLLNIFYMCLPVNSPQMRQSFNPSFTYFACSTLQKACAQTGSFGNQSFRFCFSLDINNSFGQFHSGQTAYDPFTEAGFLSWCCILSSFVAGLKYYKTSLIVGMGICQWALNYLFRGHPFKISGNNYLIYTIIPKIERNEAFMC